MEAMIRGVSVAGLVLEMPVGLGTQKPSAKLVAQTEGGAGLIDGTVIYENGKPAQGAGPESLRFEAAPIGRLASPGRAMLPGLPSAASWPAAFQGGVNVLWSRFGFGLWFPGTANLLIGALLFAGAAIFLNGAAVAAGSASIPEVRGEANREVGVPGKGDGGTKRRNRDDSA
jgi:hypothetical protein